MDREIHPQADVQHRERHGDQVQLTHRENGEGGGAGQAGDQADHGDQRQLEGTEAGHHDHGDQAQGQQDGRFRAFHHAQHFLVRQHGGPGQAQFRARGGGDAEFIVGPADIVDGRGRREKAGVVQSRLREDELAVRGIRRAGDGFQIRPRFWGQSKILVIPVDGRIRGDFTLTPGLVAIAVPVSGHEFLPRQAVGAALPQCLQRSIDACEDGFDIHLLAVIGGVQGIAQHLEQALESRVPGQSRQERLHLGEIVGQVLQFRAVEIQQAGFPEHRQCVRVVHELEQVPLRPQPLIQQHCGVPGLVRRGGFQDDQDVVVILREQPFIFLVQFAPGEFRRQHVLGVGVDGDVVRGIAHRKKGEGERRNQHHGRVPAYEADPLEEQHVGELLQHVKESPSGRHGIPLDAGTSPA